MDADKKKFYEKLVAGLKWWFDVSIGSLEFPVEIKLCFDVFDKIPHFYHLTNYCSFASNYYSNYSR